MPIKRAPGSIITSASTAARGLLLRETSEATGASWAFDYVDQIKKTGRAIEGGWPGTLSEARARVMQSLPRELSARGLAPLSAQEIVEASAVVSAVAKRCWLPAAKQRSP